MFVLMFFFAFYVATHDLRTIVCKTKQWVFYYFQINMKMCPNGFAKCDLQDKRLGTFCCTVSPFLKEPVVEESHEKPTCFKFQLMFLQGSLYMHVHIIPYVVCAFCYFNSFPVC